VGRDSGLIAAQHIFLCRALIGRGGSRTTGGGAVTFEEFAAARLRELLRYAAVLTGDRRLAEDVVQEVLIRAHARWSTIAGYEWPERRQGGFMPVELVRSADAGVAARPAGAHGPGARPRGQSDFWDWWDHWG
jgi:hypothetical protein